MAEEMTVESSGSYPELPAWIEGESKSPAGGGMSRRKPLVFCNRKTSAADTYLMKRKGYEPKSGVVRTAILPIFLSRKHYEQAHEAAHSTALLWNELNAWLRSEWLNGSRPGPKELEQYASSLKKYPLCAQSVQTVAYDMWEVVETARTARRNGSTTARAPHRIKQYRPLSFSTQAWRETSEGDLALSFGRGRERIILPMPVVIDPLTGLSVPSSLWGELQLCWDIQARQWSLHIPYRTEAWSGLPQAYPLNPLEVTNGAEPVWPENTVLIGIDPGIINSMVLTYKNEETNTVEALVLSGRGTRSSKRYRNKEMKKLQSRISRTKEGSRKNQQLVLARKKLSAKTKRRTKNDEHNLSAKANAWIREQAVDKTTGEIRPVRIAMGDVRGIEKNTNKSRRVHKHTRGDLSQWSRGTIERYLSEKTGILLEYTPEPHTTQSCPKCSTRRKQYTRDYVCKVPECSVKLPRDVVGSGNIGSRAANGGTIVPWFDDTTVVNVMYQRATHYWTRVQSAQHAHYDAMKKRNSEHAGKHVVEALYRADEINSLVVAESTMLVPRPELSSDSSSVVVTWVKGQRNSEASSVRAGRFTRV